MADQRRFGAGGGEGETDAGCGLDDAGADLQQPQAQRGELGFGERIGLRDGVAERQDQPVGGGMQDEPDLIGERRLVRSEASWLLCILIRFSAWPRAQ